jgi:hypothetical protein
MTCFAQCIRCFLVRLRILDGILSMSEVIEGEFDVARQHGSIDALAGGSQVDQSRAEFPEPGYLK